MARTLDVMGDGEPANPAAEPGWYNYNGFWWFWNGERWMPPSNPQRAPVASVLAWVSWLLLLTFFWPMLVVAWVVPLAVRSAASDDAERAHCDEALNTYLSGFVGIVIGAVLATGLLLVAEFTGQTTATGVAGAVVFVVWLVWTLSLFVATVIGAVYAVQRKSWRCSWALPLTAAHRTGARQAHAPSADVSDV